VFKFREIWPTANRQNRASFTYLTTKNIFARLSIATARLAQLPGPAPNDNVLGVIQNPDFIQTVSLSAELYPNA